MLFAALGVTFGTASFLQVIGTAHHNRAAETVVVEATKPALAKIGIDVTVRISPDFPTWARSFGADAWRVETTEDFEPALASALRGRRLALIELVQDPEYITPSTTITALRAAARR